MSEQFESKLLEILEREAVEFNEHHYEGLCRIAQAINRVADAINENQANHQVAPKQANRIFRVETFSENTGVGTARSTRPGKPLFVFGRDDMVPEMDGCAFEGELVSAASTDIYGGLSGVAALDLERRFQ